MAKKSLVYKFFGYTASSSSFSFPSSSATLNGKAVIRKKSPDYDIESNYASSQLSSSSSSPNSKGISSSKSCNANNDNDFNKHKLATSPNTMPPETTSGSNNYLRLGRITTWLKSLRTNPHQRQGVLVVTASFITSMFTTSLFPSMGVYQAYYLETMFKNESAAKISWITTTCVICLSGMMVVGGIIFEKIGPRFTILIGTNMMVLGYLLASFSTRIWQLILTQGLLVGTGAAVMNSVAMVLPLDYFDGGKGLAIGIATSGAGIGGMWMPPLIQALIDSVGIHWTLRIVGFIVFVVCNICSIFQKRPPPPPSSLSSLDINNTMKMGIQSEEAHENQYNNLKSLKNIPSVDSNGFAVTNKPGHGYCSGGELESDVGTKHLEIERPGIMMFSCNETVSGNESAAANKAFGEPEIIPKQIKNSNYKIYHNNTLGIMKANNADAGNHESPHKSICDALHTKKEEDEDEIRTEHEHSHYVHSVIEEVGEKNSINKKETATQSSGKWWMLLDPQILMDIPVWLLFFSLFFLMIATNSLTGYSIASANLQGISPTKSSLIPTVMGITHTIGNIISGMLADYVGAITIYLVSLVSSMIFTFAFWYPAKSYAMFMVLSLMFGLVGLNTNNTLPVIIAQFYGLKRLPSTTGIVLFGGVIGGLCGNYAVAAVYDKVDHRGKFKFTILLTGIIFGASSLFGLAAMVMFYWRKKRGKLAIL
ncbi:hypothetical protein H4219_005827 [Mycoemilia scoparia]|uniref:Major facilitator superfamily (MFS) profile domain-containing protein n=1 Tax=Mycoemilia scoparia TaxID=417184 RepID=A0A9W7ZVV3_9FUNG|nr:hypothetical protein H4219_005827 [Mycoemilia scoparia]